MLGKTKPQLADAATTLIEPDVQNRISPNLHPQALPPDLRRYFLRDIGITPFVVLLIVGLTLIWVAYDEYHQAQEAEFRLLKAHARNADVQVSEALSDISHLLNQIAGQVAGQQLNTRSPQDKAFAAIIDQHSKDIPELGTLLLTDAAGRIRSATVASIIGRDVSQEPYFAAHLDRGPPKMFMSRPDKHLLGITAVTFSLPIVGADRQFLGIAAVTIGFDFFPKILQVINPDDSASMSIIFNRDGDLLLRRENPEKFFGNNIAGVSTIFKEHFSSGMHLTRHVGPSAHDGKTRLFLVQDVGDTGLGLILSRQLNEVLANWHRNVVIYTLIFLFTSMLVISLAVIAARRKREILANKEELIAAKHQAEEANLAKSKFLAAASHDLRQPIHAQGLFLNVLSRTELTAYQSEVLTNAMTASKASSSMLNALLDFARIEAEVIEPRLQPFHLQPLLNKLELEFEMQADTKGIAYRSRETDLVVQSDPILVELILRNLISNAIRYTDNGGLLVVCRKRGDQAVLEVWDTGLGIAHENQQEIFREFHQFGNPERDQRKGLGLGLAIANGLARTLGQCLTLCSVLHRGSLFRLTLPISSAVLPTTQLPLEFSNVRLLNLRVLVIDDDELVRAGMLYLLRGWGCVCCVAESIEAALEQASLYTPDLVISDYRLREQCSGIEAIAALRALLGDDLPALLITGDTAPDLLQEALASGIPLLHKPVSAGELSQSLLMVLKNAVKDGTEKRHKDRRIRLNG